MTKQQARTIRRLILITLGAWIMIWSAATGNTPRLILGAIIVASAAVIPLR